MRRVAICFFAIILIFTNISALAASSAPSTNATEYAYALYDLGLFKGMGLGENSEPIFDLDRALTRQEATILLVRLLGAENNALHGDWSCPFSDVESWALPYVAYAYTNGITSGISDNMFGSTQIITNQQYITMLLRALGYNERVGDFNYDKALNFSDSIGLTDGVYVLGSGFTRGDVAWLSCKALLQPLKGNNVTLLNSLSENGIISFSQYNAAMDNLKWLYTGGSAGHTEIRDDEYYSMILSMGGEKVYAKNFYTVPGSGVYAGYTELKNFSQTPSESFRILYKGNYPSFIVKIVDLRRISPNDIITWSYNGHVYHNTRAECYELFDGTADIQNWYGITDVFSQDWFQAKFGKTYDEWSDGWGFSAEAYRIVELYLMYLEGESRTPIGPELEVTDESEFTWTSGLIFNKSLVQIPILEDAGIPINEPSTMIEGYAEIYSFPNVPFYVPDMTDEFYKSENAVGTFSGIRMKKENGVLYFWYDDVKANGIY